MQFLWERLKYYSRREIIHSEMAVNTGYIDSESNWLREVFNDKHLTCERNFKNSVTANEMSKQTSLFAGL